jgi:hypothetical protein
MGWRMNCAASSWNSGDSGLGSKKDRAGFARTDLLNRTIQFVAKLDSESVLWWVIQHDGGQSIGDRAGQMSHFKGAFAGFSQSGEVDDCRYALTGSGGC